MARIVRKIPLWERVKNKPIDLFFQLNESAFLNDFQLPVSVALMLNLVFYITCLILSSRFAQFENSNGLFRPDFADIERIKLEQLGKFTEVEHRDSNLRPVFSVIVAIHYGLGLVSFLNAVLCFEKYRGYVLIHSSKAPSSTSARRKRLDYNSESDTVWELRVWNSNESNLRLFCLFSPLNVIYMKFMTRTNAIDLIFPLLISGTLYMMSSKYETKLHDRELINREMLHEYNTKFVYPNTSKVYRDVCSDTSSRKVLVKPSSLHSVFKTHSLKDL
ncbi:unnamed protein product [Kuraishia capsulata CBS 1993]|uniref:Nuclear rim protein 1 n=1 Tax=Kuraishia capsulata CBS 1993 TaxID=1382522 RepID=W6MMK8_9ASCO|nr:uncharacterized protein KUCA_T00002148001 [Kuraishia capsulata CBS 1993]CDK26177.1 unnamed protein product [Kuraishia capsulata CBS 1993]